MHLVGNDAVAGGELLLQKGFAVHLGEHVDHIGIVGRQLGQHLFQGLVEGLAVLALAFVAALLVVLVVHAAHIGAVVVAAHFTKHLVIGAAVVLFQSGLELLQVLMVGFVGLHPRHGQVPLAVENVRQQADVVHVFGGVNEDGVFIAHHLAHLQHLFLVVAGPERQAQ